MKEFKKAFMYAFITQIVCWGIFTLCDEFPLLDVYDAEWLAWRVGVLSIIILLVLYFIFAKKIIKKNNLSSKSFNVFLIVLWIILSALNLFLAGILVENNILHPCFGSGFSCFLNGFEYIVYGALLILDALIIVIWKILSTTYGFFKNRIFKA